LTVQIWYPATIAEGAPKASYALRIEDYDQATKDTWGVAGAWPTSSVLGAELSSQRDRYPVVLYSHGFGQPSFSGTFQTEFLASHGYIVFSIGHTGTDGRVRFPDGYVFEPRAEEPEPPAPPRQDLTPIEMYRLSGQRPAVLARRATLLQDIRFVLDRLEEIEASPDQRFHGRLDLASIGGLGFSNGGALFFEATLDEPRIGAAANMDGGLNGLRVLTAGARKPILLVQASDNYPRVSNGEADAGMEEFFVEVERETWQMLRLSSDDWYKATIQGTEHPYFSDAFLITSAAEGLADPHRVHLLANRLTLAFFDRYLKHAAVSPILGHEETLEGLQLLSKLRRP
jgi:predicted dienelactone hydrolase